MPYAPGAWGPDHGRETCAWCHRPIVQPRTGRPRRYCADTTVCRTNAYRLRARLDERGAWTREQRLELLTRAGRADLIDAVAA